MLESVCYLFTSSPSRITGGSRVGSRPENMFGVQGSNMEM